MAYDALNVLQTLVTKTTGFNSTGYDMKTGTPRRGMVARFLITNYIAVGTAGTVWTASIEESTDNTTFTTLASAPPITGGTAALTAEIFVPFSMTPGRRYIRSVTTMSVTSGTPSMTYLVDLGTARP